MKLILIGGVLLLMTVQEWQGEGSCTSEGCVLEKLLVAGRKVLQR